MVAIIMTNSEISPKSPNQLVGNMGLFHVCYELSKRGWNCLPTSRNAKGIDLVIYSQDAKKMLTIQVKSLSHKNPVPFGKTQNMMAEFLIVCVLLESPVNISSKQKRQRKRSIEVRKRDVYLIGCSPMKTIKTAGIKSERVSTLTTHRY
jgi:hypothetical protein